MPERMKYKLLLHISLMALFIQVGKSQTDQVGPTATTLKSNSSSQNPSITDSPNSPNVSTQAPVSFPKMDSTKPNSTTMNPAATTKSNSTTANPPITTKPNSTTASPTATTKPNSTTVNPPATTKPNSTTMNPPATTKPNSTTVNPPATTKPNSTTVNPPATTKPNSTTVNPPATTKPNSTTVNPPATTKPNSTTVNPPSTTKPNSTTVNPPATTKPNSTTVNPPSTTKPNSTTVNPPATTKPNSTTVNPPATTKPNSTTVNPPATSKPNSTTVNPPATTKPNSTTVNPPATTKPNSTTVNPPATTKPNSTTVNPPATTKPNSTSVNPPATTKPNSTTVNPPATTKPNSTSVNPPATTKPNSTTVNPPATTKPNSTTVNPPTTTKPNSTTVSVPVTTNKAPTSRTEKPITVPTLHKPDVYINEIMVDKEGGFHNIELHMSDALDATHFAMVMVDGETSRTMSVVYLRVHTHQNGLMLLNFNETTVPIMKSQGIGIAIYDTNMVKELERSDWTVTTDGLVDALVIGMTYDSVSEHLLQMLTPGMNPFIFDPSLYGRGRTISRCSRVNVRSTDMYALINPSLGDDNLIKCHERMVFQNPLSLKISADCSLFTSTNKTSDKQALQMLMKFVIKEVNKNCHCGITRMHVMDPKISCCGGTNIDMKFVAPNKAQDDAFMKSYKKFVHATAKVPVDGQTYTLDTGCYRDCCSIQPTPQKQDDSKKNIKVTVAVIVSCLTVFLIIVIVVVMYMRRKKSAVYQFRMSRLDEEDDLVMDGADHDEFVGGQEATFDLKR